MTFLQNQPQRQNQRPANNSWGGGGGGGNGGGANQNSWGSGGGGGNGGGSNQNANFARNNANGTTTTSTNRGTWACMHCDGNSYHSIDLCNNFLTADVQRRYSMMRRGGHCYKCLDRNHKAQDCSLDVVRCNLCNTNEHHTLLHPTNRASQ